MVDRKYYVGCPFCGKMDTKVAVGSDVEVRCMKCRNTMYVTFINNGYIQVRYDDKL